MKTICSMLLLAAAVFAQDKKAETPDPLKALAIAQRDFLLSKYGYEKASDGLKAAEAAAKAECEKHGQRLDDASAACLDNPKPANAPQAPGHE
jgi:hypothetical protein